jgi:hypothetical protein
MNISDGEILALAAECGVIAVRKHEFDGKRFNHVDDLLDGDAAGLVQFARLLLQAIAEAEKTMYVDSSRFPKDTPKHNPGMVIVEPVHAIDMSQERVDETAKHGHEPVAQCTYPQCQATNGCAGACSKEPVAWREVVGKTTQYYDYNEDGRGEPLYLRREWVGLTDEEIKDIREDFTYNDEDFNEWGFAKDIEAKLKEKNIASESAK